MFFWAKESSSQNEEINPSILLLKFYKFLASLMKFWVERCTIVQENNTKNGAKFSTWTNPFDFHCTETQFPFNFQFFKFFSFFNSQQLLEG